MQTEVPKVLKHPFVVGWQGTQDAPNNVKNVNLKYLQSVFSQLWSSNKHGVFQHGLRFHPDLVGKLQPCNHFSTSSMIPNRFWAQAKGPLSTLYPYRSFIHLDTTVLSDVAHAWGSLCDLVWDEVKRNRSVKDGKMNQHDQHE